MFYGYLFLAIGIVWDLVWGIPFRLEDQLGEESSPIFMAIFFAIVGLVWCLVRGFVRLRVEARGVSVFARVAHVSYAEGYVLLALDYEINGRRFSDRVTGENDQKVGDLVEVKVIPSEPGSCELVRA